MNFVEIEVQKLSIKDLFIAWILSHQVEPRFSIFRVKPSAAGATPAADSPAESTNSGTWSSGSGYRATPASSMEVRKYVVLHWPHRPSLEGLWEGPASITWNKLVALTPNQSFMGSGVRVRKVKTLARRPRASGQLGQATSSGISQRTCPQ